MRAIDAYRSPKPCSPTSGTNRHGADHAPAAARSRLVVARRNDGEHVGAAPRRSGSPSARPGRAARRALGGGAGAVAAGRRSRRTAPASAAPRALPSPTLTSTFSIPSSASVASAPAAARLGDPLDADHLAPPAARGSPSSSRSRCRPRAPARRPRSSSAWQIAATTQGCEIVCSCADRKRRVRVGAATPAARRRSAREGPRPSPSSTRSSAMPRRRSWRSTIRSAGVRKGVGQRVRRCTRAAGAARAP